MANKIYLGSNEFAKLRKEVINLGAPDNRDFNEAHVPPNTAQEILDYWNVGMTIEERIQIENTDSNLLIFANKDIQNDIEVHFELEDGNVKRIY